MLYNSVNRNFIKYWYYRHWYIKHTCQVPAQIRVIPIRLPLRQRAERKRQNMLKYHCAFLFVSMFLCREQLNVFNLNVIWHSKLWKTFLCWVFQRVLFDNHNFTRELGTRFFTPNESYNTSFYTEYHHIILCELIYVSNPSIYAGWQGLVDPRG